MYPEDRNFKVVFLVDARRRKFPTEKPVEVKKYSRGIRLCVLKLLTYFAHVRDDNPRAIGDLRCGHKIFHSYDYPPCKRDYLKQLSLKNFQEFEKQLESDLAAFSSSVRGKRAPRTPQVLTATSVRQALDDVIHDFQWDGPDVCSPVKNSVESPSSTQRRTTRSTRQSNVPSKCVFLMMPCPVTRSELEQFCDFGPDDSMPVKSEFLQMVIPTSSSSSKMQFHEQNIVLFWVDTSPWLGDEKDCSVQRDNDGFSLVSSAMQELGGCIIPVHAIVSREQDPATILRSIHRLPGFNSAASNQTAGISEDKVPSSLSASASSSTAEHPRKHCKESDVIEAQLGGEERRCSSFLLFTSVLDHYMRPACKIRSDSGDKWFKLCLVEGGQIKDVCQLQVTPLLSNAAAIPRTAKPSPHRGPANRPTTSHKPLTGVSDRNLPAASPQNNVLIKAKIDLGALPVSDYQDHAVFACTGYGVSPSDEGREVTEYGPLSTWFTKAMVSLSRHRKVLLVDLHHPDTSLPVSAVLEPLTSTTASLRILRSWPASGPSSGPHLIPSDTAGPVESTAMTSQVDDAIARMSTVTKKCAEKYGKKIPPRNQKEVKPKPCQPTAVSPCPADVVKFRPHLVEPWYAYAPSGGVSTKLLEKMQSCPLYDKLPEGDEGSTSVEQLLQKLEEVYSRPTSSGSRPTDGQTDTQAKQPKVAGLCQDVPATRQSPRLKRRKSLMNVGFRTERIISNSLRIQSTKEPSPQKPTKTRVPGTGRSINAEFTCPTFNCEQDVIDCVRTLYEKTVSESLCPMHYVQLTTSMVLTFMKSVCTSSSPDDNPLTRAQDLLSKNLLVSSNQLRDKYQVLSDKPSQLSRAYEAELQVLLRLEMEAISPTEVLPGKRSQAEDVFAAATGTSDEEEGIELPEKVQKLIDEIVSLLRTVPFLVDVGRLKLFLSDTLLQNYVDSLPLVLRAIYDELMQPLPSVLVSPSSELAVSSVQTQPPPSYRSASSLGSFAEPSVSSIRTRSLVRHPSLADMGTKRVIPVPSRNAAKKKDKVKEKKEKESKKKEKKDGSNSKTVRRNLFTTGKVRQSPRKAGAKLQRSQSVAVMQNVRRSPRRHPNSASSHGPLVLKTKVVEETPGKKQVLHTMLLKQERARKVSAACGEPGVVLVPPTPTRVVEESPLRPAPAFGVRRSPRHKPHIHPGNRRTFYSVSGMHDLKRARNLGSRIAGNQPATSTSPGRKLPPESFGSRHSLLSEICSPGSLETMAKETMAKGNLGSESLSRNRRSRDLVASESSADRLEKDASKAGASPFKTPTRAPRRINFRSPEKSEVAGGDDTAGAKPIEEKVDGSITDMTRHNLAVEASPADESKKLDTEKNDLGTEITSLNLHPLRKSESETNPAEPGVVGSILRRSPRKTANVQTLTPSKKSNRLFSLPTILDYADTGIRLEAPSQDGVTRPSDAVADPTPNPNERKRKLPDETLSPKTMQQHMPSPRRESGRAVTPNSLLKWQRRKRPRLHSPKKVSMSPVGREITSPTNSPKLATPSGKRVPDSVGASKSPKPGTSRQYRLGKVCKANVNLLGLMPSVGGAPSHGSSQDSSSAGEAFTFLDSHLDSDSDIGIVDFPKNISPLRGVTIPSKGSASAAVFTDEEESSTSMDEVFLSGSSPVRNLVTTPLTTGGLFELINSPLVASVMDKTSKKPRVSFSHSKRGGRQLYPANLNKTSGTGCSFNHRMLRRSSSLGSRRLSSSSPKK